MGAMNRYVTLQQLGDGTYGSVVLGQRVDTGEKVKAGHATTVSRSATVLQRDNVLRLL